MHSSFFGCFFSLPHGPRAKNAPILRPIERQRARRATRNFQKRTPTNAPTSTLKSAPKSAPKSATSALKKRNENRTIFFQQIKA